MRRGVAAVRGGHRRPYVGVLRVGARSFGSRDGGHVTTSADVTDTGDSIAQNAATSVLEVNDLKVHFPISRGFIIKRSIGAVKAVLSAQELVGKIEAQYNSAKSRLESSW